jgi:hypothetical protein
MEPVRLDVPAYIIDYALNKYEKLRPLHGRRSGIPDAEGVGKGQGDFLDFVATDVLFDFFRDKGKQVASLLVSGRGDDGVDMQVWEKATERALTINVKTSNTHMRSGLHLIIKGEELKKKHPELYIQCIMRVGRIDPDKPRVLIPSLDRDMRPEPPHLYVLGWVRRGSPEWETGVRGEIPNTGDKHPGFQIEDKDLRDLPELVGLLSNSL